MLFIYYDISSRIIRPRTSSSFKHRVWNIFLYERAPPGQRGKVKIVPISTIWLTGNEQKLYTVSTGKITKHARSPLQYFEVPGTWFQ